MDFHVTMQDYKNMNIFQLSFHDTLLINQFSRPDFAHSNTHVLRKELETWIILFSIFAPGVDSVVKNAYDNF